MPALAAHGNDVKIQGNPRKTLVSGEKGVSYRLVEKGKRLTATVKGPVEVTVLLHGTTASAAAGLFLDKKKIHFVDLKGTSPAILSTGGSAGPLKTETVSVPDGAHEIAVEAFTGGAAVSFRVPHAGGGHEAVAASGKRRGHKAAAAAEPAALVAEPIAAPPAEVRTVEATPLTSPPVAAATPPAAGEPPATAATPPASAEDNSLMMGEPPPKPAQPDAAATPPVAPADATMPAPAAATSTTTVSMELSESKHSSATYWVAGAAVLFAAGAITSGALSSGQNSSYTSAKESANRASMLSTANTELILSEALVGATLVALGASAILAW